MPCFRPVLLPGNLSVPCGKCEYCIRQHSQMWVDRMLDELSSHNGVGCFVTLTYSPEWVPRCYQAVKKPFQKFMKRLRKALDPLKIRYYACGEYGGKGNRPHYHAVIFGWQPEDFVYIDKGAGLGRSAFLDKVWQYGFTNVCLDLNADRLKYCTRYLNKLDDRYHKVRPWSTMSRRPGIGFECLSPVMLMTGLRFREGKPFPVPRYYIDKLEEQGFSVAPLRAVRRAVAENSQHWLKTELDSFALAKEKELRSYFPRTCAFPPLSFH